MVGTLFPILEFGNNGPTATAGQEQPVSQSDNQAWDGVERRERARWHVGREIPIAFICAILFQTAGGIWWAASLSLKIDSAIATISEFKVERYTKDDGRRDRELLMAIFEQQRQADREHERRLAALEERAGVGARIGPGITRPRSAE